MPSHSLIKLFFVTIAVASMCGRSRTAEPEPIELEFKQLAFEVPRDEELKLEKHVPQAMRELSGKQVRLVGAMHFGSVYRKVGIEQFVLIEDNLENIPTQDPARLVIVELKKGDDTSFSTKPIVVEGTLKVEAITHEGKILAVYALREAKVQRK